MAWALKIMRKALGILIIFIAFSASAEETLCPVRVASSEGDWSIPESAFTKQEALKAIELLKNWVSKTDFDSDYIAVENPQIMLRGYLLKLFAMKSDTDAVSEFCEFMLKQAYVRH